MFSQKRFVIQKSLETRFNGGDIEEKLAVFTQFKVEFVSQLEPDEGILKEDLVMATSLLSFSSPLLWHCVPAELHQVRS